MLYTLPCLLSQFKNKINYKKYFLCSILHLRVLDPYAIFKNFKETRCWPLKRAFIQISSRIYMFKLVDFQVFHNPNNSYFSRLSASN